jgi:hypothetical protein
MDDYKKLEELNVLLTKALNEYKSRGREYAKAYREYRVALRKELLKLKAEGTPVTITGDLARGEEHVAELKEQEIITESLYKSCQEAINSYKLQIRVLYEQIKTEYNNG